MTLLFFKSGIDCLDNRHAPYGSTGEDGAMREEAQRTVPGRPGH